MTLHLQIQDQAITQLGVDAIIDFYRALSIAQFECDGVLAFATGIDSPFLNVAIDTRQSHQKNPEIIHSVSHFFHEHHVPWTWFVAPSSHEHDLLEQGFSLLEEAPALYFDLTQAFSAAANASLLIQEAHDDLHTWIQPINEGFKSEENDDSYRKLNADIMQKGTGKFHHYIAYYNNSLAGAGTLFLSDQSVMIHNVATKTDFTKRGIASALTLHMMMQAKQLGFKHCFLDASEEAFNLYQKIGFKVYSTTFIYSK